ncbi:hypothetical protein AAG906_024192 [Vitis piasezkii]
MTSQILVEVVHDPSGRSVHTTSSVGKFVGRNCSPRQLPMGETPRLIYWNEALQSFHKGLSAGLLRQATYTITRLGLFKVLTNKAVAANNGKPLPLYQKALCGVTAGAIGAIVGSPADSSLIRTSLTAVQAMTLNMGMLASYDQSVEFFKDFLGLGEASTVVGPSAVSGFFASTFSLPFDYVKTQIQKMQPDASGKYPYTNSLDCAMKTLKYGGPLKFHTGFPIQLC